MKKQLQWFISALALFLSVGIALNAQNTPKTQPPDAQSQQPAADQTQPQSTPEQSQQPAAPPQAEPNPTPKQAPDQAGQAAPDSTQPTAAQSFTGTVVKQGDKYVFQDAATGNTYDIDHQDEVQKFEGKKVKVRGTLDASGKMIHIQ